jgi:hypothetical protein
MTLLLTLSEQDIQTLIFALEDKLYQPSYLVDEKERERIESVLKNILAQFPLMERR